MLHKTRCNSWAYSFGMDGRFRPSYAFGQATAVSRVATDQGAASSATEISVRRPSGSTYRAAAPALETPRQKDSKVLVGIITGAIKTSEMPCISLQG